MKIRQTSLAIFILFLLTHPQTNAAGVSVNVNALDAIMSASAVVQITLLSLVVLSVLCWAVGFTKFNQYKKLLQSDEPFLNKFWKASSLDALYEDLDQYHNSAMARVFKAGYLEMQKLADSHLAKTTSEGNSSLKLSGVDNLERSLRKACDTEIANMETRLTILATTGSTAPFIGLFGTVWGIMESFHKIGQTGSASLAVVAPGISEALITTAIGLVTAIPAVVLYNHFISRIKKEETALNNFSTDFLNIVKRNFFKGE